MARCTGKASIQELTGLTSLLRPVSLGAWSLARLLAWSLAGAVLLASGPLWAQGPVSLVPPPPPVVFASTQAPLAAPAPPAGQATLPTPTPEDQIQALIKRIETLEQERDAAKAAAKSAEDQPADNQTDLQKSNSDKAAGDKAAGDKQPKSDQPNGQPKKADSQKEPGKEATKDGGKETSKEDWVDLSSEKWNVKLGGHVQMDYVMWPQTDPNIADPAANNYFSYRRLRLVADGTGYGVYDFRLQMTLEPGSGADNNASASPDVKDAYFTVHEIPLLGRMRIGNFFVPFGLEQVTNDTNNIFLERSIPTQGVFTADREVGLAFYNCTEDQNASLSTGIFFDDLSDTIKTRIDDNQGYRISGRGTWLPYYDEPSDGRYVIHTGAGVLYTDDFDDRVRFRARPQVQRGPVLIDSGDILADGEITGNLELAIVWGRVTLQNEAYLSNIHLLNGTSARASGAYSHISYFLTGESRVYERFGQHGPQFGRNRPFTNFFATPGGTGWGAWEAKARWSYLELTDLNRGQYNDFSAGMNWYWSDRTRIMFDWIHPWTDGQTVFRSTESDLLGLRFDFNW